MKQSKLFEDRKPKLLIIAATACYVCLKTIDLKKDDISFVDGDTLYRHKKLCAPETSNYKNSQSVEFLNT